MYKNKRVSEVELCEVKKEIFGVLVIVNVVVVVEGEVEVDCHFVSYSPW